MYSRIRFDISARNFVYGLFALLWAWRRERLAESVVRACSPEDPEDDALVCLSVRSGFDLLLEALSLPAESEVLVSAVTHPDMVRIIEHHRLRAVPVDLDPETMQPRQELLERAVTRRTRAVLVAHLFGGRVDLTSIAHVAKRHGLLLVEDCAQAFRGPQKTGRTLSDVSMYSFGSLKTTTALGGALLRVRDAGLRQSMQRRQAQWPVQGRRSYLARLLKFLLFTQLVRPRPYLLLVRAWGLLGRDFDSLANGAARSFSSRESSGGPARQKESGKELSSRIRCQPSSPLLALLAHRFRTFDESRLARRRQVGECLSRGLSSHVLHPGGRSIAHTHWIFPVVVPDPEALVTVLRRKGFDAAQATSNIAAVKAPEDRPDYSPTEAIRIMSKVVFLPVYPELSDGAAQRLIEAVRGAVAEPSSEPG